ncbi:MAG: DUF2953 domain-containing protein [Clostridia bacterium]|nr:DUF2953 domain-containing protein [Clostridia bacterium]
MVLVLFLLAIIFIISLIIEVLLLSEIKIYTKNFTVYNLLFTQFKYNYEIEIRLYLCGKFPYFEYNTNKNKAKNSKLYKKLKDVSKKKNIIKDLYVFDTINYLKPKIESLNMNLQIGTSNAANTAYTVATISAVMSILFSYFTENKNSINYHVVPLYNGNNTFNLSFNSIISIKMVHIISMICIILQKRRDDKHERASNRRSYANSYE